MKTIKSTFIYIFSFIAIIVLTLVIFFLIGVVQQWLFVPEEYQLWIFKYPTSRFVFIYELYLIIGFFYIFFKGFKSTKVNSLLQKWRKVILTSFISINILLLYIIVSSVTVITKDKIIDYSFLAPKGKEYSYQDVVKITTGVHGKGFYIPFTHSKGDFYYIIELSDGVSIDLTEVGAVNNYEHEYFILEKLDSQFVEMNVPKLSSLDNFEYTTKHLDKIYTDKIRNILENMNK